MNLKPDCFNHDTKILCLNSASFKEEYIPIQDLKNGILVKTYLHGYRRIIHIGSKYMVNDPFKLQSCMYKMDKNTHNELTEDLIVSGGNSMLIDNITPREYKNQTLFFGRVHRINNKILLAVSISDKFTRINNNQLYIYYNLIVENDGYNDRKFGIWANGILMETPSKKHFLANKYDPL
jgi:hypothetical protein